MVDGNSTTPTPGAATVAADAALSELRLCPVCNPAARDGALHCPQCGRSLPPPAPEPQQSEPGRPTPTLPVPAAALSEKARVPLSVPNAPSLNMLPVPAPAAPRTCTCGAALTTEAQYCSQCGLKADNALSQQCITRIGAAAQSESVALGEGDVVIGKEVSCALSLGDDPYVSRRHARIHRNDGQVLLEDLGSSNGTFLRVRRPIVLEPGDEIVVGTSVLHFGEPVRG